MPACPVGPGNEAWAGNERPGNEAWAVTPGPDRDPVPFVGAVQSSLLIFTAAQVLCRSKFAAFSCSCDWAAMPMALPGSVASHAGVRDSACPAARPPARVPAGAQARGWRRAPLGGRLAGRLEPGLELLKRDPSRSESMSGRRPPRSGPRQPAALNSVPGARVTHTVKHPALSTGSRACRIPRQNPSRSESSPAGSSGSGDCRTHSVCCVPSAWHCLQCLAQAEPGDRGGGHGVAAAATLALLPSSAGRCLSRREWGEPACRATVEINRGCAIVCLGKEAGRPQLHRVTGSLSGQAAASPRVLPVWTQSPKGKNRTPLAQR